MNSSPLISPLRSIALLFKVLYFGISNVILTGFQEKKWGTRYIKQLEQDFGAELNDSVVKRTVVNFTGFVPLVYNAFTRLHGRNSNLAEKERLVLYFLCSVIFDDFTDKKELTDHELYQIYYHPESYQPKRIEEKIFLYAHLQLKSYVRDKAYYQEVLTELFQVQVESANQFNSDISNEDLKRITFAKGGSSTLFCHFYLDIDASELEQKCWRQLGVLFQLTDDLLDIWEDLQSAQDTLPTRIKDSKTFDVFYMQQMEKMKLLIAQLPFSYKYKEQMIFSVVSVCSVGKKAIHQLSLIQGNQSELGDLKQIERKALIVDMAKLSNMLYCSKFAYSTSLNWINYMKAKH